jgi:two-component system response regulator YesN
MPQALFNAISHEYGVQSSLPLLLCDVSGNVVYSRVPEEYRGQFDLPSECDEKLRVWRARIAEDSLRWGEAYFTTTPLGLVAFAVPLMEGDLSRGCFISGFVAFPEMAADIGPEITRGLAQLGACCAEGLVKKIAIRTVTRRRIRYFADQLMKIMVRHGFLDRGILKEKREKTAQQLSIAHYIEHLKKSDKNVAGSIIEKQEEIIVRVKRGDITGAKELLNEYLGYIFFDTGMNFDVIKIRIIELIVLMSRSAIELGAGSRELLKMNQGYLAELNRAEDYETLCLSVARILENFIGRISTLVIDKKKMRVRLMLDFIQQNFADGISAADVAQAVSLSTGRALHLLTRETGRSFSEHVTRCRVNYGKYLLLQTDHSIADIALQAGFYDHSQFTRTFKSLENTTPLRFRNGLKT